MFEQHKLKVMKAFKWLVTLAVALSYSAGSYAQLELEKRGSTYVFIATQSGREILSFPERDFVLTAPGGNTRPESVVTATGEIHHHWIIRGMVYTGADSTEYVAGFYKMRDENTLIFSVAFSDTALKAVQMRFFYADTVGQKEGIRMAGDKHQNTELRAKALLTCSKTAGRSKGKYRNDVNFFYTTRNRSFYVKSALPVLYDFLHKDYFTIHINELPAGGKIFFNMPVSEMLGKAGE